MQCKKVKSTHIHQQRYHVSKFYLSSVLTKSLPLQNLIKKAPTAQSQPGSVACPAQISLPRTLHSTLGPLKLQKVAKPIAQDFSLFCRDVGSPPTFFMRIYFSAREAGNTTTLSSPPFLPSRHSELKLPPSSCRDVLNSGAAFRGIWFNAPVAVKWETRPPPPFCSPQNSSHGSIGSYPILP
mmetsp:Transcript_18227/g.33939  ORF Transcript_18227/g.33939 Transcript_18227/m.33939 type:complete len:182 (-) Transcript_18227:427-972(-)